MNIFKAFWQEFVAAFRAERAGGRAAELSREHEAKLRADFTDLLAEMKDEREAARIAALWAEAKTPAAREAAVQQPYVLRDSK